MLRFSVICVLHLKMFYENLRRIDEVSLYIFPSILAISEQHVDNLYSNLIFFFGNIFMNCSRF